MLVESRVGLRELRHDQLRDHRCQLDAILPALLRDVLGGGQIRHPVAEITYDPFRAVQLGQELAERGITASSYPQTGQRTIPASARLRDAIVQQKLVLPDDPELRQHAANAIARQKTRGWRLEAPDRSSNIDAVVALMMALDRLENQPEPVRLLGWL